MSAVDPIIRLAAAAAVVIAGAVFGVACYLEFFS